MSSSKKEIDFVRGKGGLKDDIIKGSTKPKNISATDQLFETRKRKRSLPSDHKLKDKKSKKKRNKDSDDIFEDKEKIVIESMSFSRLPESIVIYGCIQEISDYDLKMCLCGGIVATVSITNISDSYTSLLQSFAGNESMISTDIEVLKPNGMFKIGEYFPIKIISKSKTKSNSKFSVKASLNPKDVYSETKISSFLKVSKMPVIAAVDSIEDHGFVMDIGFDGIKAFLPKGKAETALQKFKGHQSLCVGQLVLCAIDSVNDRTVRLVTKYKSLSDFKLTTNSDVDISCLIPGLTVSATVLNVSERGLEILVLNVFKGFVPRSHLKSDWDLPKNMYQIGDKIEGTVLYRHPITKQIAISLKPRLDHKNVNNFRKNVKIGAIYDNAVVMGRDGVGNVVFKLPDGLKAICHKKHLFDTESDDIDIENKYSIGSTHRCRVSSINLMDSSVLVTLRQSLLQCSDFSTDNLEIGSFINGKVEKVCKSGAVIQIGLGIRGFIPNYHLAETAQIKSRETFFPKGMPVKCRIIKIDRNCNPTKVILTHKKSLLNKKLNILSSYENAKKGIQTDGVVVLVLQKGILVEFFNGIRGFIPIRYLSAQVIQSPEEVYKIGQIVRCSVVDTDSEKERMTCSLIKIKDKKNPKESSVLSVDYSVAETQVIPDVIECDEQSDAEGVETQEETQTVVKVEKNSRKERNEKIRLQEEELRKREESLMDPKREPESIEELERSVLSSPNSSIVWLKYIAFYLDRTEISKARDVAERAIKTISFREERERLNVWVSYLNLEHLFGSPQTLNEVFERAVQYNEPLVVYRHLANIYSNANKTEETESLFNVMTKKFKLNKEVWIDFGLFYMKNKRLESSRKLLQKSLICLPKREHIEVISKFAQMEFKWGEAEQAKTLFEKLLSNFPKRIDLWSVYIDMMWKYSSKDKESEDSVRDLFERLITYKLSAKQMKFVFKRYIDFEKQFNNFERIERIKQKALEYVEGKTID